VCSASAHKVLDMSQTGAFWIGGLMVYKMVGSRNTMVDKNSISLVV
jgi:hypothetical protein